MSGLLEPEEGVPVHLALGADEDVPGVGHRHHLQPGELIQQLGQALERLKFEQSVK